MYGKATRVRSTWQPEKITCKRFGVAYKAPDQVDEPAKIPDKQALNQETMDTLMQERDRILNNGDEIAASVEILVADQYEEEDEAVEPLPPPNMDLMRAIFADSGSDSEPEEKTSVRFRPVFSKKPVSKKVVVEPDAEPAKPEPPVDRLLGADTVKAPKPKYVVKVKLDSIEDFESEQVVKKVRMTAADFM